MVSFSEEQYLRMTGQINDDPPAYKRKSKFNNKKTVVDGHTFDSKKEARRYSELVTLQQANVIKNLRLQVPYDLTVNGMKVCKYVADFVYDVVDGGPIVEDAKGVRTAVYVIKCKLMKAVHGIVIKEV